MTIEILRPGVDGIGMKATRRELDLMRWRTLEE